MYSVECVVIHQTSAAVCKPKHESNLAKWEKTIMIWCAKQHEKIKKIYELNHSKSIISNAWAANSELSKSFSDLRVISLSNKIRYIIWD